MTAIDEATYDAGQQLSPDDPLYRFLTDRVLRDVLGAEVQQPVFEVYGTEKEGVVYRFHERETGVDLIGKFYARRGVDDRGSIDHARAVELMQREFENLRKVWDLGLNTAPHRVVRPFAVNEDLDALLVEEYVAGKTLDVFLQEGVAGPGQSDLARRLIDLALFLALLHHRSQQDEPVEAVEGLNYLQKVVGQLAESDLLDDGQRSRLTQLRETWLRSGKLGAARRVLVHGDVTPINFVFTDETLIAIDLERLHAADPALDLGSANAEIIHAALLVGGNVEETGALRQILLETYAEQRQLTKDERIDLAERVRFFTGTMLLRIARNDWLDRSYRRMLVPLAERMLTQ